jgi:hypothetical protein
MLKADRLVKVQMMEKLLKADVMAIAFSEIDDRIHRLATNFGRLGDQVVIRENVSHLISEIQ